MPRGRSQHVVLQLLRIMVGKEERRAARRDTGERDDGRERERQAPLE
jgi:hypothetical protein